MKVLPFLIETLKKGEGIIKKKFSDLASLDSPVELIGDINGLKVKVRDFYEVHGSLSKIYYYYLKSILITFKMMENE